MSALPRYLAFGFCGALLSTGCSRSKPVGDVDGDGLTSSRSAPSRAAQATTREIAPASPALAPIAPAEQTTSAPGRVNATSLGLSCDNICSRSRALKCKQSDECMPNCLGMGSLQPCSEAVSALYACLQGEPLAHWECAEDGIAAIRDGFCEKEQAGATSCFEKHANQ